MAGLYVPLNVNFFEDDRVVDCPPLRQLLYVRGLCAAKRLSTDGWLTARQLTALGLGIDHDAVTPTASSNSDCGKPTANVGTSQPGSNTTKPPMTRQKADFAGAHKRWHVKRQQTQP